MGKVRIKRGIFIGILGILFLLLGIQQVNAEETEQLCHCTCSPIETTETIVQDDSEEVVEELIEPELEDSVELIEEEEEIIIDYSSANIILNEVYPAPLSGETEFIELYNAGDEMVDMNLWYLMDESGKKFIVRDLELEAGAYIFFDYDTTKIALNNGGDTVYLYDSLDNLRHSLTYPGVEKGDSLINNNGEWEITLSPSPGVENIIDVLENVVETQDSASPNEESVVEDEDNVENVETQNITSPEDNVILDEEDDVIIEADNDVMEISEEEAIEPNVETQSRIEPGMTAFPDNNEIENSVIYENQDILNYKNWIDDAKIQFIGKIISPAGGWIDNRCFIAKENQAIPILCTSLAAEFKEGENIELSGEVVFKNGVFYRFDPDLLSPASEEINLVGDLMTDNLDEYKVYNYQGLVTDVSGKYHKLTLETENAGSFVLRWSKFVDWDLPLEGDLIKGLLMADNKSQLWLLEKWEDVLLDESGSDSVENLPESSEDLGQEDVPKLPALAFGLGTIGALGTGKAVWSYRDILKKIIVRK